MTPPGQYDPYRAVFMTLILTSSRPNLEAVLSTLVTEFNVRAGASTRLLIDMIARVDRALVMEMLEDAITKVSVLQDPALKNKLEELRSDIATMKI